MQQTTTARWRGLLPAAVLCSGLVGLAGCGSTKAARGTGGSGAIAQGECNQTDSTESCCLKQHPGQYERCGAVPPNRPAPAPGGPPPLLSKPPEIPSAEEAKERRERCGEHYVRCIERGGEYKEGRVYNETRCKQCRAYCIAYGFWPLRIDKKVCP